MFATAELHTAFLTGLGPQQLGQEWAPFGVPGDGFPLTLVLDYGEGKWVSRALAELECKADLT